MKKIMIAMSGGVDSSVTAYLLQNQGYECCGCTMKLFEASTCCSVDDVADAKSVAARLNMEHYVFNYKDDFTKYVINDFIDCYQRGETPNPCIMCNKHLKFGKLIKQAEILGYDGIATGHYAQIEYDSTNSRYLLKKAVDSTKDQSYVLYNLTQAELSRLKFPLGSLTKADARKIAEDNNFVNAKKHDSQDICFVPDGDYASVIKQYTNKEYTPGDFVDKNGNILGKHKGIIHYTIGQRRGLGISSEARLYVIQIDVPSNTVVLGSDEDLFTKEVYFKNLTWIAGNDLIPDNFRCSAKIRYRMTEQPASVTVNKNSSGIITEAKITFDKPQRAPTPGQSAVLYDGDIVLGGGTIFLK